jgi:hypothetical protein
MHDFVSQYPRLFSLSAVGLAVVAWMGLVLSWLSGWRSLAERYRTEREFPAHRRRMQSAMMQGGIGYNNILTLGSDAAGLYLRLPAVFRFGQPPLFVPWTDIAVDDPTEVLFQTRQTLRLGPDAIPLRVRMRLAQFLLEGRGARLS